MNDGYIAAIVRMAKAVETMIASAERTPVFALPTREIAVIAPLDVVGQRLARDEFARVMVRTLCAVGRNVNGSMPTVMMLDVALELAGVPVERVGLGDLGLVASS